MQDAATCHKYVATFFKSDIFSMWMVCLDCPLLSAYDRISFIGPVFIFWMGLLVNTLLDLECPLFHRHMMTIVICQNVVNWYVAMFYFWDYW